MKRRDFLKTAGAAIGASAIADRLRADQPATVPRPLPRQVAWQNYELGLVYHFDLDVYMPGGHKHELSRRQALDAALYKPRKLDTDQWLAAAKEMGAGYAIFTATHHQGFLQWQSDAYPFGLRQVEWRGGKGDIVGDFVESCRKHHIAPGIYLGIRFNAHWGVYNYKVNAGKGGDDARRAQYMRACEKMVTELCTNYGPLCEIWFDGGVITPEEGGPDLLPIVEKHQPRAVFYHSLQRAEHRWAGNEAGAAGYPCYATIPSVASQIRAHANGRQLLQNGDPDGRIWCPAMCDAPIREHDWLWVPNREDRIQPLSRLVDMYYKSVGRNANLIIGAVPDTDGLIPEPDFKRYSEFGAEVRRRFSKAVASASGVGSTVELRLPKPTRINHVIIVEDIIRGERIRKYTVEGLTAGNQWTKLCEGSSVGHKRIQQFGDVEVAKVRLKVSESIATPIISNLSVYSVT